MFVSVPSVSRSQLLLGSAVVLVVAAYAGLAGWWTSRDPGWYASLTRPSFQPPDWVFGVMWPYNFLALAVAGLVLVARSPASVAGPWVAVLAVSVVLALTWAYLFYVPHALVGAAVALGASAVGGWVLLVLATRSVPWLGLVLLPYALWVTVATALAVAYARATA